MPLISVIVPVYKVEPYLRRCVDSILGQSFGDFELILVDDGSPDGCPVICDEYREKDSRVVVIHQENGGLSAARNAGIDWAFANSDSEWLFFADSDDWIHPYTLAALVNGAEATGLSVVIGGYEETTGESPLVDTNRLIAEEWDTETFFCGHNVNAVVAWGKLYRKECFVTIRYPVGKIHEDEFITYKILFEYETIAVIEQPLYAYYQNENGIMGTNWRPARLDITDALEERAQYFLARDNDRMYHRSLSSMFGNLKRQICMIQECDSETRDCYEAQVTKLYRQKFKEYRKELSLKKDSGMFEPIYPRFMWLYYHVARAHELGVVGTITHVLEKWRYKDA